MAKKRIGLMATLILIGSMVMACGPAMPVHEDGGSTASAGRPNGAEPTIRRISTHSMKVPLSALASSTAIRNGRISIGLQVLLMEFANDLAEGKTDELETVSVKLRVDRQIDEVRKYLEDRSIVLSRYVESTSAEKDGWIQAMIPFMLVEDLAALPNVLSVTAPDHAYQHVDSQLLEAFAYYKGGFKSAEKAAELSSVRGDDTVYINISFQERTYLEDMETFLAGQGVEPESVFLGTRQVSAAPFHLIAHVPISLLGTMAHRPGVFKVELAPVPDNDELPRSREAIYPKHSCSSSPTRLPTPWWTGGSHYGAAPLESPLPDCAPTLTATVVQWWVFVLGSETLQRCPGFQPCTIHAEMRFRQQSQLPGLLHYRHQKLPRHVGIQYSLLVPGEHRVVETAVHDVQVQKPLEQQVEFQPFAELVLTALSNAG